MSIQRALIIKPQFTESEVNVTTLESIGAPKILFKARDCHHFVNVPDETTTHVYGRCDMCLDKEQKQSVYKLIWKKHRPMYEFVSYDAYSVASQEFKDLIDLVDEKNAELTPTALDQVNSTEVMGDQALDQVNSTEADQEGVIHQICFKFDKLFNNQKCLKKIKESLFEVIDNMTIDSLDIKTFKVTK